MEARRETPHTSKYSSVMTNVTGNIIAPLGSFRSLCYDHVCVSSELLSRGVKWWYYVAR